MENLKIRRFFVLYLAIIAILSLLTFIPVKAQQYVPPPNLAIPATFDVNLNDSVISWNPVFGAVGYVIDFHRVSVGGRQYIGNITSFDLHNLMIKDTVNSNNFNYIEVNAINSDGVVFARSIALYDINIQTTMVLPELIFLYEEIPFIVGSEYIERPFITVTSGPLISLSFLAHTMGWDLNSGRTSTGIMWATITSPLGIEVRVQNWHFVARINDEPVYMRNKNGVRVSARVHFDRFYVPIDFFNDDPMFPINIERLPGENGLLVSPHTQPSSMPASDLEQSVFELTNIQRRNHGLPDLIWDARIANAARIHSEDMSRNNYLDSINQNGLGPWDRMSSVGVVTTLAIENIAFNQTTPESVVQNWMNSPVHRENILNPNITHIGVGFANNRWTQKLAQIR